MQTFAQALTAKMDELGITQTELERLSGVGQVTISKYRSGEIKDPSFGNVMKIAKALKTPISYFYPDAGDIPEQSIGGSPEKIIDHLLRENENLWSEQKTATKERIQSNEERVKMLGLLEHFILKTPG